MESMAKTYPQLMKQIEDLRREAEELKHKEVEEVIQRIRAAIDVYGLTATDLGLSKSKARTAAKAAGKRKAKGRTGRKGKAAVAKFRDEAGNTWGGRGPRPAWLRAALAAGKQLSDFAV